MKLTKYLIVDRHGDARTLTKMPRRLGPGEFAFRLNLTIPTAPPIVGEIGIELPEPPLCPDPEVHMVELTVDDDGEDD